MEGSSNPEHIQKFLLRWTFECYLKHHVKQRNPTLSIVASSDLTFQLKKNKSMPILKSEVGHITSFQIHCFPMCLRKKFLHIGNRMHSTSGKIVQLKGETNHRCSERQTGKQQSRSEKRRNGSHSCEPTNGYRLLRHTRTPCHRSLASGRASRYASS